MRHEFQQSSTAIKNSIISFERLDYERRVCQITALLVAISPREWAGQNCSYHTIKMPLTNVIVQLVIITIGELMLTKQKSTYYKNAILSFAKLLFL